MVQSSRRLAYGEYPGRAVFHHLCNQYNEATIEAGLTAIHEAEFVDYSCFIIIIALSFFPGIEVTYAIQELIGQFAQNIICGKDSNQLSVQLQLGIKVSQTRSSYSIWLYSKLILH